MEPNGDFSARQSDDEQSDEEEVFYDCEQCEQCEIREAVLRIQEIIIQEIQERQENLWINILLFLILGFDGLFAFCLVAILLYGYL